MARPEYVVKVISADGTILIENKTGESDDAAQFFIDALETHGLSLDHPALNAKLLTAFLNGSNHLEYYTTTNVVSITIM